MKLFLIFLLFLLVITSQAQIRQDYKDHLLIGTALGMTATMVTYPYTMDDCKTAAIGIGIPLAVGIGKEFYDLSGKGTPEVEDILFTVAGGVIGYGITRLWFLGVDKISKWRYGPKRFDRWQE